MISIKIKVNLSHITIFNARLWCNACLLNILICSPLIMLDTHIHPQYIFHYIIHSLCVVVVVINDDSIGDCRLNKFSKFLRVAGRILVFFHNKRSIICFVYVLLGVVCITICENIKLNWPSVNSIDFWCQK